MKVLVCGGAGYIGSHTVKSLAAEGYEVVVLDNLSSGRRELLLGGEFLEADLADREALRKAFRDHTFAAVLHFASLIQVGESYRDPQKYYRHNLVTSLNLLEAMLEAGVRRLIFSSTAAVYGVPEKTPISESHPLHPYNPYGKTKYFVEQMMSDYADAYGLKFISLRYFNAAGADPEGRLGELHSPETHLIPNALLTALGRQPALELFGRDFPTPDGTAIRDYIHVTDLAAAHVLALERLLASPESDFINLGANQGYSVLEVLKTVEAVTGLRVPYEVKPRRLGDVPVLLASREKAESALGWKPRHSGLDEIIATAWLWHSKQV
jgi:UDP-glucose-4-epimerase GalE